MTVAEPLPRPRTETPPSPPARRAHAGLLAGAAAYAAAALLGRLTMAEGTSLALFWPASGVLLLWFLLRGVRPLSTDVLVAAAVTVVVNSATGAPPRLVAVFVVTNLAQALVNAHLLRRHAGDLWGCGGRRRIESLPHLWSVLWTSMVASVVGTVLGVSGMYVVAGLPVPAEAGIVWWARVLGGTLLVLVPGLLAGHRWLSGSCGPMSMTRHRLPELAGLMVLTGVLYPLVLWNEYPLLFTLLVPTVWVAKRFSSLCTSAHSLLVAVVAVCFTLAGLGPFAQVVDPARAALLVECFITLTLLLGMFIVVQRDERELLASTVAEEREEYARQAQLLTTIVDSMEEGVTAVDGTGRLLLQNRAALDMLEIDVAQSPDQLAHRGVTANGRQIEHDRRPSVRALQGEQVNEDVLMKRLDGSTRHLRISATPMTALSADDVARAVMVFRDVTDEVEHEAALKAFAATVAHDLHNPLAAMIGWNEVMLEMLRSGDADPATLLRLGERLGGSADRLQELVDGLLEDAASKGRELDLTRVDLDAVLRGVTEGRGAEASVSWGTLPAVRADRLLTGQLLDNLVGNALKYVAPGTTPRVEVSAGIQSPGWVTVEVADNGIGIPEGEHEHVFERFARAHGSDPAYQGTGLGLAIVKRIVTRHDGTISARPGADGGTVVEFTLPAA